MTLEPNWGQPLSYDFSVITEKGCHDLLGLSLPVPSTTSWRAEIDGKRFSGMIEIDGSHAPPSPSRSIFWIQAIGVWPSWKGVAWSPGVVLDFNPDIRWSGR